MQRGSPAWRDPQRRGRRRPYAGLTAVRRDQAASLSCRASISAKASGNVSTPGWTAPRPRARARGRPRGPADTPGADADPDLGGAKLREPELGLPELRPRSVEKHARTGRMLTRAGTGASTR